MNTKLVLNSLFVLLFFTSCSILDSDDNSSNIDTPESYEFTRNGSSTVAFNGQTNRILMAEELIDAMMDFNNTDTQLLLQMYRNQTESGNDAAPFTSSVLNSAEQNLKGKVASSSDYFAGQAVRSAAIKDQFEVWLEAQVNEVFPNQNTLAEAGVAGQIADGTTTRYINAKGLEYDQMVTKGLLGALMTDQILNNYLSTSRLDAATNREDNDNGTLAEGQNYTTMEHYWDEAYGYVYGTSQNTANPNQSIGSDDSFLNKYVGRLSGDEDFSPYIEEIFNAFALGRAAIVEKDYELRDEQADIIRRRISDIIGIRTVFYLKSAENLLSLPSPARGEAFHDLSEAYGFIYSLQFTRNPETDAPYVSSERVDAYLSQLTANDGLWDIDPSVLGVMAEEIAADFEFTVAEAAN